MPGLFERFFGSVVRFLLAGVTGYLVRKGVIDNSLGEEVLAAAAIGIPTLLWSLWQKYKERLKFLKALDVPAGTSERQVEIALKSGLNPPSSTSLVLLGLILALGISSVACGKEQVENTVTKTVVALRAARKVTTVQHKYGHIEDDAYRSRLEFFRRTYNSVDALGDVLAEFGEINAGNKQAVLDKLQELAGTVDQLIASGDVGVVNAQSQNDYRRWLLVAKSGISAIKIAVAAIDKPLPVGNLKVTKTGAD